MPANNCMPTQGYPTKQAAILDLHGRGLGVDIIARTIGSTPDAVKTVLNRSGLKPNSQPTNRAGQVPQLLQLSPDILIALRPHAAHRNLTCLQLAALLLNTIVDEDLVDATLDDGEA